MNATATELLTYGVNELAAFRADMAGRNKLLSFEGSSALAAARELTAILRNQDARRNAAGLTRDQAAKACVLAAAVERRKAQL